MASKKPDLSNSWMDSLYDGAYVVDKERVIIFWNKAAEQITGYSQKDVIHTACFDNILRHMDISGNDLCQTECPLHKTLQDGQKREVIAYLHHKQGHRLAVRIRVSPIVDAQGEIVGATELFSAYPEEVSLIRELELQKNEGLVDPLLKIGNRLDAEMMFQVRQYEQKMTGNPFGALFMDIDYFKNVNDTHGHIVGDRVLTMVSRTVATILRQSDTFARWGGDEFLLLLPNVSSQEELQVAVERILFFVEKSDFMVKDEKISVTVSLGATLVKPGETMLDLMERIDVLMYQSKSSGRNRFTLG